MHILLLLTVPATAHPVLSQESNAAKPVQEITYTKVGERELKLDLIAPARGEGPYPAVVVIHGGAWRGGKKEDVRLVQTLLANAGYVSISPQYRFCPAEQFPAQVEDVKAAVRWLRSHASEHGVDTSRIGAIGFSAGGHLALLLGLTSKGDGLEGAGVSADAPSSKVQAVVNYFGPTELGAADIPEISRPLVRDFLGGTPAEKPELCKQASPLTFVTKDDPAVLTFHGTKDHLVPHTQALKLIEAMNSVGVPGRVEILVGAGHGWEEREMRRTLAQSVEFFDRQLKSAKAE
jgi:acetyl esterase/lipase